MYPGRGWRILTRSNRQPKGTEMTPRSIPIALAALVVAALVPASAAAAGGKKAPRQATFKAQISGNQDITWSYPKTANVPAPPTTTATARPGSSSTTRSPRR
jgi:hypothetical protein